MQRAVLAALAAWGADRVVDVNVLGHVHVLRGSGAVSRAAGHQVVGGFPARCFAQTREPRVDMGPVLADKAERLGVIQIAAIIVIAHRLSTVRDADTIYVFENGRITESGSFNELAEAGGLFSHMAKLQSF